MSGGAGDGWGSRRGAGGAVLEPSMAAEEERIAKAALAELPDDGVVVLDAGAVTERFAAHLPVGHGYTVITNSVPVAMELAARTDVTLHLMGGRLHRKAGATLPEARELDGLSADVAFVVPGGVSFDRGLTSRDPAEGSGKKAIMNVARRVVALADHTRIGDDRMSRFAALQEVDCLITDTGLHIEVADRLRARVPRLLRV
ncbi:DeoR/GlpR family DNA-binding transcription regulator [Nocardiopsis lucentensis]|uniref:DeoR/GlpR family DNA-binding transcription regulator n=1 Tax=Nocardiopsis lucentensis TaxID=53441 RepID=UPI00034D4840|nr:DeoR family transcriptional regulator [Nocardiopsis lucentensis]